MNKDGILSNRSEGGIVDKRETECETGNPIIQIPVSADRCFQVDRLP